MSERAPSSHTGMGAILYPGGAAFRVWAPHADAVYVTGAFNDWAKTDQPLACEGNGYWSVDVPGVKAGDEYKYVIINDAEELWRIDPYAKEVTPSTGNAVVHDPTFNWGTGDFHTPPWHEMVIYEMHLGAFNEPGGAPGYLNCAIERLGYLQSLGVNAIQVMPPMEFASGFSWGYNPDYIFAIESDYGGSRAFKEFVKAAHAHGIAIIFDVAYNHFGLDAMDLWQFDGWSENNKGGIYFYNDWRSPTPWGDTRPDYSRDEVRRYIRDNALMWLDEYGVDGLRWDATAYIRNVYGFNDDPDHDIPEGWTLMQWINDEIDARQPRKISIAEDLRSNPWLTRDTAAAGAGFDAQWDPAFVHSVRRALIAPDDHARNMLAVRDAIQDRYNEDAFERVIYTESHDEVANGRPRVSEGVAPDNAGSWRAKKLSALGAALVFTTPGIPMIFQGQEILEDKWIHPLDPIDWSKKDRYSGILRLYQDLIHLRRNCGDATRGLLGQHVYVHHVNNADKFLAFHRWDQGGPRDSVIIVVNLANRSYVGYTIGLPRKGAWKVRFNSDWNGYAIDFSNHPTYHTVANGGEKDGMPYSGEVGIGPYSVVILSQDD